jgi:hypothetical protein
MHKLNQTLLSVSLATIFTLGATAAHAADDAKAWKKHVVFSDVISLDKHITVEVCKELMADTDIEGKDHSPQVNIVLHEKHQVSNFKTVAMYPIDQTYLLKMWEGDAQIKHLNKTLNAKTEVVGVVNKVTGQVQGFWRNGFCQASYVSTPVEAGQ